MSRKTTEKEALHFIDMFLPGSPNKELLADLFKRMSDAEFAQWIENLESGKEYVTLFAPNLADVTLSIERNYKVAEALGFELFQQLKLTDQATGQIYLTPNKHLIGMLPLRRQVQMLAKKRSIPGSNHVVDERSGQASGDSKGSRLSGPEIQVNVSKGLNTAVLELVKFRGGDAEAYNQMNRQILETGEASLTSIMAETPSIVKSNKTLSVYLSAMMLRNNLV
ncbi:RNA polymerase beta subunit [Pseudomonas phage Psa21]|uniref:Virion structural protein n=1 Tax=Pseudomonas phage Psa21 TaxID=2530023 RepID=A0A481W4N6_9CAUD|nr:RNA polymerase beta subunit [Pseudomonas phage Psa21]QBJ02731.1 virion structural protein [Pseudomonas phage Psa21]